MTIDRFLGGRLLSQARTESFKARNAKHMNYRARAVADGIISFDDLVYMQFVNLAKDEAQKWDLTPFELVSIVTNSSAEEAAQRLHDAYLKVAEHYGPTFTVRDPTDLSYISTLDRMLG